MLRRRGRFISSLLIFVFLFSVFAPAGLALAAGSVMDNIVDDSGNIKVQGKQGLEGGVKQAKYFVGIIIVICLIAVTAFFALNWVKVASSGDNAGKRSEALKGVFWALAAAAGIGATGLLIAVAYNAFK